MFERLSLRAKRLGTQGCRSFMMQHALFTTEKKDKIQMHKTLMIAREI